MTTRYPQRIAAIMGAVLVLAGCVAIPTSTAPSNQRHRTSGEATADLMRVPGVISVDITVGTTGTPWQRELDAVAELDSNFTGSLEVLSDYVLAQAWSVTTKKPTSSVTLAFALDGKPVDTVPLLHKLGFSYVTAEHRGLALSDMVKRYGPWPGPVPAEPDGLRAASPSPAP